MKGIAKKDIAGLKEPIDYTALCKLAADFSDGIIQQSEHVNEEVLNYARESGKPVLEYQSPENFAGSLQRLLRQGMGNRTKIKLI